MKTTKIFFNNQNVVFTFVSRSESTRNGFRHVTEVFDERGNLIVEAKVNYSNRTWESYDFQTSMSRAVDALLELARKERGPNLIDVLAVQRIVEASKEPNASTNISDTVTRIQEEALR